MEHILTSEYQNSFVYDRKQSETIFHNQRVLKHRGKIKEKGSIWFKCRYEVVYMICSGVRWEQEQKIKKETEGRE